MVALETVRASNAGLKSLGPGLVAVFVGGTSGIGETIAREFVRNTIAPKVYLVGRNQQEASRIQKELNEINPDSKIDFIQSDTTLLANVDKVCGEIQAREQTVNLLFMSSGFLDVGGRSETTEGLDKKFNLNYYSRVRFTQNLLPQLTQASKSGSLSRNVSVLGAGREGKLHLDDLSLKKNYSLGNCAAHAITMNSLSAYHLAALHPGTSFVHLNPGMVKTKASRGFGRLSPVLDMVSFLLTPLAVPLKESGERNLYAATSAAFAPQLQGGETIGADGAKGTGAYLLNWSGDIVGNQKILKPYREQGVAEKVWNHTQDVFNKVCVKGETW